MDVCPECDETIEAIRALDPGESCPACGRVAESVDSLDWMNVARVANLAEAGFICDELTGLGIEARTHQLEDFDAASHRSTSQYLIRVRADLAQDAAKHVRQYLNEDAQDRPTLLDAFRFYGTGSGEPVSWRPIAFVVLAGVASFALGQRFSDGRADRRPQQNSLLSTMGEIERPFVTAPTANQPRYRLSFDRRQQAWTLQTDRDNDGQFEASEHFRATGAAR
jgi:hypothetical protein